MGKRSNFKRRPQDAYDTPVEAVVPLIGHLRYWEYPVFRFWEPCAGSYNLCALLEHLPGMQSVGASDISPRHAHVEKRDALLTKAPAVDYIITNPPWTRSILHPMIEHFSAMRPTWLLFDADWAHTKQSAPYMKWCHKIVSVGRVKWIPDSPHTGKDNCAWYLFDQSHPTVTEFHGRAA